MEQKLINYINNLSAIGIILDPASVEQAYNGVSNDIRRRASVILLPLATASGVVYAMNNKTGDLVPFDFSRATGATLIDKDMNLQVVTENTPRIDYGNYSENAKLLIERESTNIIPYSEKKKSSNLLDGWESTSSGNTTVTIVQEDGENIIQYKNSDSVTPPFNVAVNYGIGAYIERGKEYTMSCKFRPSLSVSNSTFRVSHSNSSNTLIQSNSLHASTKDTWNNKIVTATTNTDESVELTNQTVYLSLNNNVSQVFHFKRVQFETGNIQTSYIPTNGSPTTRTADQLIYKLPSNCQVYLKTTRQDATIDKTAGIWNVHEDLNNEGIEVLAILPEIPEKLRTFVQKATELDIQVDIQDLAYAYNNLPELVKQTAETILLPFAVGDGVVYGMDNKTGDLIPFDFSRSSSATSFDKGMNLQVVSENIPRIDYGNYSQEVKLLVEKGSINYAISNNLNINNGSLSESITNYGNTYLFTEDNTNTYHRIFFNSNANSNTLSVIVKSNGLPYCVIRVRNIVSVGENYLVLDLNTGQVAKDYGDIIYKIQNLEDGWYKIGARHLSSNNGTLLISGCLTSNPSNSTPSYLGDGQRGFYFACAQMENLNVATSYIPTTTSPVTRSADLLTYSITKPSFVYLKTSQQEKYTEKTTGEWNIHEDVVNDGIEALAIMPHYSKNIQTFLDNAKKEGISVNEKDFISAYENLDNTVKNEASVVLLPFAASYGTVYGMDNKNGSLIPFDYSRASSATFFDKDMNIQLVEENIPRIDYGNYSESAKLLIERERTNLHLYTDVNQDISDKWSYYNESGIPEFVFGEYLRVNKSTDSTRTNTSIRYQEQNIILNNDEPFTLSFDYYNELNGDRLDYIYLTSSLGNVNIANIKDVLQGIWLNKIIQYTPTKSYTDARFLIGGQKTLGAGSPYQFRIKNIQVEIGDKTSYIPTYDTPVTRSADLLSYKLRFDSNVYLKTTKQDVMLNKPAGVWNIDEDLNNEGLQVLAVFEEDKISGVLISKSEAETVADNTLSSVMISTQDAEELQLNEIKTVLIDKQEAGSNRTMFL